MYKLMIVEDDLTIASALQTHFTAWDFEVQCVADFQKVMEQFAAFAPHLVLLDISLLFCDGYHWCSEIRAVSKVPVIFLSSAADNLNIVMAMNLGGDDFIAKPFDLSVLTAKVQALLRRTYTFSPELDCLEAGGVVLNLADATAVCNGARLELTKNEYRILQVLFEKRGKVVSRETLMQRLWETDSFVDENTLTVNVARLRKKLAGAGVEHLIETKKGIGYWIA